MWLNDFEFDVIWTAFQLLLELHSHISVKWPFSRNSVISEFSFLGKGSKRKPGNHGKSLFFYFFLPKLYQMDFLYLFLYFLVVDNAITLFNCFFRDFRGSRDFRVFDLTKSFILLVLMMWCLYFFFQEIKKLKLILNGLVVPWKCVTNKHLNLQWPKIITAVFFNFEQIIIWSSSFLSKIYVLINSFHLREIIYLLGMPLKYLFLVNRNKLFNLFPFDETINQC